MSTFSKTMDLIPFMKANGINTISKATFKETGLKGFITDVDVRGRISHKVDKITKENAHDLAVSWFTPEDGEPSWMVHPKGSGGLEVTSSFSI